jgi:cell wall-associated NlpC family hydrolase
VTDYLGRMNAIYHAVEACNGSILEDSKGFRRILLSNYATCGSMASTLVATALLLIGCQSAPHGNPPPRPSAPGGKAQVTILPPSQFRKPVSPTAWKAEADRWLGVKYRKGGLDRNGIDCSGLAAQMYLAVTGIALPRSTQDQSRCGNLVSRTDLRPGDLIFFVALKDKQVDHVGIYLGDAKFVHASYSKGVVGSSLLQDYYVQRYHSARRVIP